MEEELRVVFTIQFSKEFTGVVVGVVYRKMFLLIFQYGFKKELISNQLTIVTVESRNETEEKEVPPISEIPVDTINGVYILLRFKKEDGVDIN